MSRLQQLFYTVTRAYDHYSPTKAARAIQVFVVDELSNWYVRLNRKRFWKSTHNADQWAAYQTLYTCLVTVAQLAAPIAPFYMEQLYQDLSQGSWLTSVHLTTFPKVDDMYADRVLEEKMQQVQTITSLVHALRKKHKVKVRQPLAQILLPITDPQQKAKRQRKQRYSLQQGRSLAVTNL